MTSAAGISYDRCSRAWHRWVIWATPWTIAQGVLYLVSDESKYVTGAELAIDGGFIAR